MRYKNSGLYYLLPQKSLDHLQPRTSCANSPDEPCATLGPDAYFPSRGNNPGSPFFAASVSDWLPGWPGGNRFLSNTPDGSRCDNRVRRTHCNNGTCGDWAWNSSGVPSAQQEDSRRRSPQSLSREEKKEGRRALKRRLEGKLARRITHFQNAIITPLSFRR